jgi:lipopolysaccharide transport system ATP-binding protein
MSEIAISAESLSKCYPLVHERGSAGGYRTLRDDIVQLFKKPRQWLRRGAGKELEQFWALNDVSFQVKLGEVVGIIGRNGAGKSTLLKILSRITKPTSGRCILRGRVGSLLEVGTGFHPELTGRENIFMNGSILGMSRQEIKRNFDAIVEFAEVERFLDTPVKRYSSGMYVRLAFAVAAHLEPEILIVDEVLAVGDAAFQKKCLGKMQDVAQHGRTVLFVSHNMAAIRNLCQKTIVLNGGKTVFDGPTSDAIDMYNNFQSSTSASAINLVGHETRRKNTKTILREIRFLDEQANPRSGFSVGETIVMEFLVDETYRHEQLFFGIGFDDSYGTRICSVATYLTANPPTQIGDQGKVRCIVRNPIIAPGMYRLSLSAGNNKTALLDAMDNAVSLKIEPDDYFQNGSIPHSSFGQIWQRSEWSTY